MNKIFNKNSRINLSFFVAIIALSLFFNYPIRAIAEDTVSAPPAEDSVQTTPPEDSTPPADTPPAQDSVSTPDPNAHLNKFKLLAEELKNSPLEGYPSGGGGRLSTPTQASPQSEENDAEATLLVDAYETHNTIIIIAMLSGVDPEKLSVYLGDKKIIIKGKRERENYLENKIKNNPEEYVVRELKWFTFSREILLPAQFEKEKTKTSIHNGKLKIELFKHAH